MKNKILKIWGLVMVVAILAGLLVPAVVPVSAANLAFSNTPGLPSGTNGQFMQGSWVNQFVVGPDGKTAFAYSNAAVATGTVGAVAAAGSTSLTVSSTNGYANNGSFTLPSQATSITYTAKTTTSFTGIPAAGNLGAITAPTVVGNAITQTGQLMKSLDGGVTWTNLGYGAGLNGSPIVALAISPQFATDTTILAASNAPVNPNIVPAVPTLFRSTDGGANFGVVPTPTGGTFAPWIGNAGLVISSIAISQYYLGGQAILVGYTTNGTTGGGAALFVANTFTWTDLTNVAGWAALNSTAGLNRMDVLSVAFSPKYTSDSEILVVAANNGSTFLRTRLGTDNWDLDIGATVISNDQGTNTPSEAGLIASTAFPSDYDWSSNNRVFVGLGDSNAVLPAVTAGFDAYRVNGQAGATSFTTPAAVFPATNTVTSTLSRSFDLNVTGTGANYTNVSDIAFSGVLATGTLAVAQVAPAAVNPLLPVATILYSATGAGGSPAFVASNFLTSPISGGGVTGLTQAVFNPVAAAGKPYTLYVGTQGAHSALYTSTDYMNYNWQSLIGVSSINNIIPGLPSAAGTSLYMVLKDDAGNLNIPAVSMTTGDLSLIMKSTDGGNTWMGILSHITGSPAGDTLNITLFSPTFATDNTMYNYMGQGAAGSTRIWKSTDGGTTWSGYTSPNSVGIATMTLIDANTYYIGATAASGGGLYKSGIFTQVAALDGKVPFMISLGTNPSIGDPNVVYIPSTTGELYWSSDAGVTFTALGGLGILGPGSTSVSIDPGYKTNKMIYAYAGYAAGSGGTIIYRWIIGTSTTWETFNTLGSATFPTPVGNGVCSANGWRINNLTVAGDGTMYATVNDAGAAAAKLGTLTMYRNSYPQNAVTDPLNTFTQINYTQVSGFPTNGNAVFVGPGTYSGTIPFGADVSAILPPFLVLPANVVGPPALTANKMSFLVQDGPIGTGINGYPYQWLQMTDTLVAGPAITAPTANAQVPTGTTFSWAPVTGATAYAAQLATDSKFQGLFGPVIPGLNGALPNTGATSITLPNGSLNPGTTYYFRVQVAAPLSSKFSAPVTFSVLLAQSGNSLFNQGQYGPVAGATGVALKPVFQWAAVQGAQSYDLQVADNPVFVNPLDAQTGLNTTVWTETKTLNPNSVYYWRVRAVAANGTASDWVAGSFTTVGPVSTAPATTAAPAPPVTIVQTQPAVTITQTPAAKFFDPNSGLYFNSQSELQQYQAAHPANAPAPTPATPSYMWVIIVIGAILVIAVIVLIVRTRKV